MVNEGLTTAVRDALRDGPFSMRHLAAESGLSYDVLRSWRSGRRRPNHESGARLEAGLRQRAEQLVALADAIRQQTSRADAEPPAQDA
jgi:ribosome-binding protein aMBF1 (putative translation factor)